jgi:predicted aldo/keto reductase-like oxidoreductase
MQLGRILPSFPREKLIVQTKVAPMASTDDFLRTFDRSMKYLRLDYVDLLSLHGINNRQFQEHSLRKGGCLPQRSRTQ